MVLTDVADVVRVRVVLAVVTSNRFVIFIDVVLEQRIPCLVCRQEQGLSQKLCELLAS